MHSTTAGAKITYLTAPAHDLPILFAVNKGLPYLIAPPAAVQCADPVGEAPAVRFPTEDTIIEVTDVIVHASAKAEIFGGLEESADHLVTCISLPEKADLVAMTFAIGLPAEDAMVERSNEFLIVGTVQNITVPAGRGRAAPFHDAAVFGAIEKAPHDRPPAYAPVQRTGPVPEPFTVRLPSQDAEIQIAGVVAVAPAETLVLGDSKKRLTTSSRFIPLPRKATQLRFPSSSGERFRMLW